MRMLESRASMPRALRCRGSWPCSPARTWRPTASARCVPAGRCRAWSSRRAGRSRATRCAMSASRWRRSSPRREALAEDAAEQVQVEYETLPPLEDERCFRWTRGDAAAVEAAFAAAPTRGRDRAGEQPPMRRGDRDRAASLATADTLYCRHAGAASHPALRLRRARHRRERAAGGVARHGRRLRLQGQALPGGNAPRRGPRAGCAGR